MKLNVMERLLAMELLPKEGNFATLRLIRDTVSKLGLSADELKEYKVIADGNTVKWDNKGNIEKDIPLKERESDLVKETLIQMDKDKKMEQKHFTLFEKFVEVK